MNLQMTYAVMYLELNLIAVILVGIIRYKTAGISRMVAQRNFAMAIDAEMGFFLSDTFYVMMANGVIPYHRTLVMISKEIYFFSTMLMCFFWFLYFEYLQDFLFVQNRKRMWASSVLVVVMTVLLLVNIYTGIFFYVDSDGSYQRGKFFLIQICVVLYLCTDYLFPGSDRDLSEREICKAENPDLACSFPIGTGRSRNHTVCISTASTGMLGAFSGYLSHVSELDRGNDISRSADKAE